MRLFFTIILLLSLMPARAAEAIPAQARCESRDLTFDSKEILCTFYGTGPQGGVRLQVSFSGGHDDTSARMEVFLGDKPLVCDPGSKTRLFGEDGEVSLTCRLSPSATKAGVVVRSVVTWSHAQFTGFDLAGD